MPKINQLNSKTVPSDNDEFPFHDPSSGTTRKITRGDLIGGAPLPANSVDGQAIADGAVTSQKIGLSPQTTANSGNGGGTWTYWSIGEMKFASIISVSRSMSGGTATSSNFVPPSGFFSSIVNLQATMVDMTSDARQVASVNNASTTTIQVSSWSSGSAGTVTGKVSLTVIGR